MEDKEESDVLMTVLSNKVLVFIGNLKQEATFDKTAPNIKSIIGKPLYASVTYHFLLWPRLKAFSKKEISQIIC